MDKRCEVKGCESGALKQCLFCGILHCETHDKFRTCNGNPSTHKRPENENPSTTHKLWQVGNYRSPRIRQRMAMREDGRAGLRL